jgi:branched-subunit amino acid aminotransferase/4-amino-4-deoxychorismate lyase
MLLPAKKGVLVSIPVLSSMEILKKLSEHSYPQQSSYFAMYSTWYGGIVMEPSAMLVPIDDHMVHRGDGVFEAMKSVGDKIFLLKDHLDRLEISSKQIGLAWPFPREKMTEIIQETLAVSKAPRALIRLFLSRGPGGFTTNPYDSVGTQFYCVITEFKALAETKYQSGVRTGRSQIPAKQDWFATIKSCNYLPNVLMKKEAVDRGLDFTFGFGTGDHLTEGSTENVVIVDKDGVLVRPRLQQILKGTTMMRALTLAEAMVQQGTLKGIVDNDVTEADIFAAKEVMMIGTTLDVLPVTEYEGKKISGGVPGPVALALRQLLMKDMNS